MNGGINVLILLDLKELTSKVAMATFPVSLGT